MDIAHKETDFYSFHNYDFSNGGKRTIATGTRTEAILDLVENYGLNANGEIKPFASSECGATGVDHWWRFSNSKNLIKVEGSDTIKSYVEQSYPEMAWWHIRALNGQIMSYMDRPDRILKIVPFTLPDVSIWTPKAHWTLYRREGFKMDGELYPTHHLKFYEFWKDVNGERVYLRSNDPDIQVQAFLDDDRVFICMNNLSEFSTDLSLRSILGKGVIIENASLRSIYFDGTVPVIKDEVVSPAKIGSMTIKGDECLILTLDLDKSPVSEKHINENFHYGDRTAVPIKASAETFTVEVPEGNMEYAELRIGISRHQSLNVIPEVILNGKKLAVNLEQSYDKQISNAQKEYAWGIRTISVPLDLLENVNKVEVGFDDEGGVISSVIIRTGSSL